MPRLLISIALLAAACSADATYEVGELERAAATVKPHMVEATADGDVAAAVKAAAASARNDGVDLVVYIGATWCEPCKRFKRALAAGRLDTMFAAVRFLEFDHDRDEQRLDDAGYDGRLIPRFVIPDASGRGGRLRTEGSVKGPAGVAHIIPRLRAILRQHRGTQR